MLRLFLAYTSPFFLCVWCFFFLVRILFSLCNMAVIKMLFMWMERQENTFLLQEWSNTEQIAQRVCGVSNCGEIQEPI